ncbi:hypothetical protein KFU94_01150 [Chloroflexi bacterium TSY]|nr:hypothetical protein [Chloroflexi bacterium TSY]
MNCLLALRGQSLIAPDAMTWTAVIGLGGSILLELLIVGVRDQFRRRGMVPSHEA